MKKYFTSESVCEGHPDKLCDYISDSILDECLRKDKSSRVACEVAAGKNMIFVTGEITTNAEFDIEKVVRKAINEIGYFGDTDIDYKSCEIIINMSTQSSDIALGTNDCIGGAGDQGIMFGYAINETDEFLPLGFVMSHMLAKRLSEVRKKRIIDGIGADGKTQVTVEYDGNSVERIDTILISVQHRESKDLNILKKELKKYVIDYIIPKEYIDKNTKILINPTGRFVIGGPLGDSGVTGRKIIVDTYGGYARHGGGAFSGKDGTKVDRSAAYMARCIAKNVVANGYASKCEVQLSYAIGISDPLSIYIDTFGTNKIDEEEILDKVKKQFNLTPKGIIKYLNLDKPIFKKTTNYGHFTKKNLPWEKVIKM